MKSLICCQGRGNMRDPSGAPYMFDGRDPSEDFRDATPADLKEKCKLQSFLSKCAIVSLHYSDFGDCFLFRIDWNDDDYCVVWIAPSSDQGVRDETKQGSSSSASADGVFTYSKGKISTFFFKNVSSS